MTVVLYCKSIYIIREKDCKYESFIHTPALSHSGNRFQCSRDELPGPPDHVRLIKSRTFKLDPGNIDLLPYDSASYVNYRNSAGDEIRLVVKNSEPSIVVDQYVEYNVNATGDTITTRYLFTMQHKSIVINNTRFHKQFHLEH